MKRSLYPVKFVINSMYIVPLDNQRIQVFDIDLF